MALSNTFGRTAAALVVAATTLLAGCAAPVTTSGDAGAPTSPDPSAAASATPSDGDDAAGEDDSGSGSDGDDQGGSSGDGDSDGGEDPTQDRVRTGPIAQYGGPAYGDQGSAEVNADGSWCKTIAVFWGGDELVPDGVRFTFESAIVSPGALSVEAGVCGTRGADRACLGLTVAANESGIFCSLLLRPQEGFVDGTAITFAGTLECPTSEVCDAVAARVVEPGPPIIVNTPDEAQDGGDT